MENQGFDYLAMGKRLRARRIELKLTQEELAELVDVSVSFVGHIERGEKKASLETIANLGNAMDISLDYLVMGKRGMCGKQTCSLYTDLAKLMDSYS